MLRENNLALEQSEGKNKLIKRLTDYLRAFDDCLVQNSSGNINELFCIHLFTENSGLARIDPNNFALRARRHIYPFCQYIVSCTWERRLAVLHAASVKVTH